MTANTLEKIQWIFLDMIRTWAQNLSELHQFRWPFYLVRNTIFIFLAVIWAKEIWFLKARLQRFLDFFQSSNGNMTNKSCDMRKLQKRFVFASTVAAVIPVVIMIHRLWLFISHYETWSALFCESINRQMIDFGVVAIFDYKYKAQCSLLNNGTSYLPQVMLRWEDGCVSISSLFLLGSPHAFIKYGFLNLKEFLAAFCLVGAFILFSVSERFLRSVSSIVEHHMTSSTKIILNDRIKCLDRICEEYGKLLDIADNLNQIWGNVILIYFLYFFPFAADFLFKLGDPSVPRRAGELSGNIFYLVAFIVLLLVASEANRKVNT